MVNHLQLPLRILLPFDTIIYPSFNKVSDISILCRFYRVEVHSLCIILQKCFRNSDRNTQSLLLCIQHMHTLAHAVLFNQYLAWVYSVLSSTSKILRYIIKYYCVCFNNSFAGMYIPTALKSCELYFVLNIFLRQESVGRCFV